MTTSSSMRVNARVLLEGERMGRILAVTCPVRTLNVWKRVRVKELKGFSREMSSYPPTCNQSRPLRHLFRERALCAIGIVLHAKIFVDLEQPLLMRNGAQKFF